MKHKRKCTNVPRMPYPCDGAFACYGGRCPSRDKYEREKIKRTDKLIKDITELVR